MSTASIEEEVMSKNIKISEVDKIVKKYFWFLPNKVVVLLCDIVRLQLIVR